MSWLSAISMEEAWRKCQRGELSPRTWLQEQPEDKWSAVVWRDPAGLQKKWDPPPVATEEMALPLDLGIFPAALKANIGKMGWPTHCSSKILANYRSPFSATAVTKLETAGAVFHCLTAMDEFGMGSSCEYAASGPVSNPWREGYTPGGSSGGAAAAVAGGLAWYALGSDTGGSVRFPAHCCGLVGFKPTYGRVSRLGLVPFASSLDTIGVLARSVADAALVMQFMAGHDPADATSLQAPVEPMVRGASVMGHSGALTGKRIGVPRHLLERDNEAGLLAAFEDDLKILVDAGAQIEEVNLPTAESAVAIYQILASAEASANLARYDGTFYGARPPADGYGESLTRTRTTCFGPEVKRRIIWGTHVLAEGYQRQFYLKARQLRWQLGEEFQRAFQRVDVIALPTSPVSAFALGSLRHDPVAMHDVDAYTTAASLAGLPALSLPTTVNSSGLPLSCQLVGPLLGEPQLVTIAAALEKQRDFRNRKEAPWNGK